MAQPFSLARNMVWTSTWNASTTFLGQNTKTNWPESVNPWSSRVADGTHPGDSFCGADSTYTGAGIGRLVFAVNLIDAAVVNDFYWASGSRVKCPDVSAFSIYRFCGRIAAYGSDAFIASNTISMSTNNFIYQQWTQNAAGVRRRATCCGITATPSVST